MAMKWKGPLEEGGVSVDGDRWLKPRRQRERDETWDLFLPNHSKSLELKISSGGTT